MIEFMVSDQRKYKVLKKQCLKNECTSVTLGILIGRTVFNNVLKIKYKDEFYITVLMYFMVDDITSKYK